MHLLASASLNATPRQKSQLSNIKGSMKRHRVWLVTRRASYCTDGPNACPGIGSATKCTRLQENIMLRKASACYTCAYTKDAVVDKGTAR